MNTLYNSNLCKSNLQKVDNSHLIHLYQKLKDSRPAQRHTHPVNSGGVQSLPHHHHLVESLPGGEGDISALRHNGGGVYAVHQDWQVLVAVGVTDASRGDAVVVVSPCHYLVCSAAPHEVCHGGEVERAKELLGSLVTAATKSGRERERRKGLNLKNFELLPLTKVCGKTNYATEGFN